MNRVSRHRLSILVILRTGSRCLTNRQTQEPDVPQLTILNAVRHAIQSSASITEFCLLLQPVFLHFVVKCDPADSKLIGSSDSTELVVE
jgi:hypothetical protein